MKPLARATLTILAIGGADAALRFLDSLPRPGIPSDCENCLHRLPEWRDGGFCYMFAKQVPTDCAQFRPADGGAP